MAPSSFVEKDDIEKSAALLRDKGYEVFVHEQTYAREHQSAGNAQDKLEALHALYADDSIDAIWAAGGGNRALYLLDELDVDLIAKNPKPLIGFSDVTALLNSIYAQTGVTGWHAQVFKNLHKFDQLDKTLAALAGESMPMSLADAEIVQGGEAEGILVGGCLSLFHYLVGTNDCPNLDGAILFLEDCSDEMSRFDRMFAHMKRMGAFEQIGALVLGEFHDVRDGARPFGFSLKDIALEALEGKNIPLILNAPFGHGARLWPLPVGAQATLDSKNKALRF